MRSPKQPQLSPPLRRYGTRLIALAPVGALFLLLYVQHLGGCFDAALLIGLLWLLVTALILHRKAVQRGWFNADDPV